MKQSNGLWAHITGKCYSDTRELEYLKANDKFGREQVALRVAAMTKSADDDQATIKRLLGEIVELKGINEYTSHDYETIIAKLKETVVGTQAENAKLKESVDSLEKHLHYSQVDRSKLQKDLKKYASEYDRTRAEKIADKEKSEMTDFISRNVFMATEPEQNVRPNFKFAEVPKVDNDTWVSSAKIQDEIKQIRDKIKKTKSKKRKKAKKNEA